MTKTSNAFFVGQADSYIFALSTAILVSFVFVFQSNSFNDYIRIILCTSFVFTFVSIALFVASGLRNQARVIYKNKLFKELTDKAVQQITPLIENVARPLGKAMGTIDVAIEATSSDLIKKILTETRKHLNSVNDGTQKVGEVLATNIAGFMQDTRERALNKPIPGEKHSKINFFIEIFAEHFRYPTFFASTFLYLLGIFLTFILKN